MTTDPFAAYRPKNIQTQETASGQDDPFAEYRPKPVQPKEEPKESVLGNVGRQLGRSASRVAETALGAPRAFGEFLEGLVPEKALVKGAEKIGLGEGASTLLKATKKYAPYKAFPTSEQVKDVSKFLFGKKIQPQNQIESKADEVLSDFAALALPLPGAKLKLLKPALLSLGGNVASEIVGKMGGSEKEQIYTKLGTMFAGSLINPGGAKKLAADLYTKARNARAPTSTVAATNLKKQIEGFRTQLSKGGTSGSKTQSLKKLDEIEGAIRHGQVEVEELEKFKQSINEARSGLYEEFKSNKPGMKAARANLDRVSKIVDETLKDYGKINPEWESYYRPANEVFGSIAQSNKARDFISRKLGKISPHLAGPLFGIAQEGSSALAGLGAKAAVGGAALETSALLHRILNSPTLRKYYYGVIQNAVKEDAVAMRENLRKLEEELGEGN